MISDWYFLFLNQTPTDDSSKEKVYHWFDTFHNTEPERHPGKTGCCLTLLMVPAVLIYGIVWFVQHQQKPPVETLVIDWSRSISYGPYPMKVSCHEAMPTHEWQMARSPRGRMRCSTLVHLLHKYYSVAKKIGTTFFGLHWKLMTILPAERGVRYFTLTIVDIRMDFLDVSLRMTHDHHTTLENLPGSELLAVPLRLWIWKFRRPSGGWFCQFLELHRVKVSQPDTASFSDWAFIWALIPGCRLWKEQAVAASKLSWCLRMAEVM